MGSKEESWRATQLIGLLQKEDKLPYSAENKGICLELKVGWEEPEGVLSNDLCPRESHSLAIISRYKLPILVIMSWKAWLNGRFWTMNAKRSLVDLRGPKSHKGPKGGFLYYQRFSKEIRTLSLFSISLRDGKQERFSDTNRASCRSPRTPYTSSHEALYPIHMAPAINEVGIYSLFLYLHLLRGTRCSERRCRTFREFLDPTSPNSEVSR